MDDALRQGMPRMSYKDLNLLPIAHSTSTLCFPRRLIMLTVTMGLSMALRVNPPWVAPLGNLSFEMYCPTWNHFPGRLPWLYFGGLQCSKFVNLAKKRFVRRYMTTGTICISYLPEGSRRNRHCCFNAFQSIELTLYDLLDSGDS